jgi:cellulose biosynthesis protein BcsQ
MKKPLAIAFATQKGGAGKSTISVHIASTLYYHFGYKVAMLDCDFPQYTLQAYRLHEQDKINKDQAFQERLVAQGVAPYPVAMSSMDKAVEAIDMLEAKGYDFILVDTPGTVNIEGLPELLQRVDYIFLPMEPDLGTIASSMSYMHILDKFLHKNNEDSNLVGYYSFWNKFLKAEKRDIYTKTDSLFKEKGFPLLNSRVESLVVIKEKRSTMFSIPEKELAKLGLGQLINEVLTLLVGQGVVTPSGKTVTFTPIAWPDLEENNASIADAAEESSK